MEFSTIRGLRFAKKPEYSGKMFLLEFDEREAKDTIDAMDVALQQLSLYRMMDGQYDVTAQKGEALLQSIANQNPELFLYGIKAKMTSKRYFVSQRDENHIYKEKIGEIVATAINSNTEKLLPVFKHMLQVWPHSKYWSVINDVLCKAYADIVVSDPECIQIVANGLLRSQNSWEAALEAMMLRSMRFEDEAIRQFTAVFNFLDLYGQSVNGREGISIPQDIYSRQSGAMQQAFTSQSEQTKQRLREIGMNILGGNTLMRQYLYRMFGNTLNGENFSELESLLLRDRAAAKAKVQNEFNVRSIIGWDELKTPEIVEWLGEKLTSGTYSFSEKQILGYRLSVYRTKTRNSSPQAEASQVARNVLLSYAPADESDQEYVLAGCLRMLGIAAESRHDVNPMSVHKDMVELLVRHADMEVNQRRLLDNKQYGGIWRNFISKFSLNPAIREALATLIRETSLHDADAIRRTLKVVADTFAPLELDNPRVLQDAIPHEELKSMLTSILALNPVTRSFGTDHELMRRVFPKVLDVLDSIVTHKLYEMHYHDFIGHLHIYCSLLNDAERRRISDSYSRVIKMVNVFHA